MSKYSHVKLTIYYNSVVPQVQIPSCRHGSLLGDTRVYHCVDIKIVQYTHNLCGHGAIMCLKKVGNLISKSVALNGDRLGLPPNLKDSPVSERPIVWSRLATPSRYRLAFLLKLGRSHV